jgi:alcohol dehydrogenase class IV
VTPENLRSLRKFVSAEVVHGHSARELAGRYARNIGARRILVVSDPGVIAAGWTGEVIVSLEAEGLPHASFSDVTPNPRASEVMLGAEAYRAAGCDAIVAVGGGSPIDCAKGIGIVVSNGRSIEHYAGVDRIETPIPPLICIPTTAGTSADVSQFAIITDLERRVKLAVVSKAIVPDVALVDPATLRTAGGRLIACTGMDAFVHSIEAFTSNAHSPMTDMAAAAAMPVVWRRLAGAVNQGPSAELEAELMTASLQSGLAFSNASLGAVHAMAHAVGGLADNPHGEANAILLDHVVAFNYQARPDRFDLISQLLGIDVAHRPAAARRAALLDALRAFKKAVGLDLRLRDRGITRSDIPRLARAALADPCMATNPRAPTRRDIETIYEEAL